MNCTRMRVVISASMTIPRESVLAAIATTPMTTSETWGKCLVGCTRAKDLKKVPSTAAAYGILE